MKRLGWAATLLLLPAAAHAQGLLSVQGFGYPTGQIGVASMSQGGANAELDAISALNPAAVSAWNEGGLAAQFVPEFRKLRSSLGDESASAMRFPLFTAGTRVGSRLMLGISSSQLLDRSWATEFQDTLQVDGIDVVNRTEWRSEGGINDLRLALSYAASPSLQVGVAGHVITGINRISVSRVFLGVGFGDLAQASRLDYRGAAYSAGAVWTPVPAIRVGGSVRLGGPISVHSGSVDLGSADVPGRLGASVEFTGLQGVTLSGGFESVKWSSMNGMGSQLADAVDTQELGFGAESGGPTLLGSRSVLRLGIRQRDLPFSADGNTVKERFIGGGIGLPLALNRASIDLSLGRMRRTAANSFSESAWTIGFGVLVRP